MHTLKLIPLQRRGQALGVKWDAGHTQLDFVQSSASLGWKLSAQLD